MSTFESMLAEWQAVKKTAAIASAREMELRKALFAGAFPDPKEGTNKITLADGVIFSATHKINRTVDTNLTAVGLAIAELTKLGNNEITPDDIFKVRYDLGVGPYKKLDARARAIVDKVVTSKPGAPTIELK